MVVKKAKEKDLIINIPQINTKRMSVKIVGDTPIIIHNWSEKVKKEMLDKQTGGKVASRPWKSPARDFVECFYWYDQKRLFDFEKYKDLAFQEREDAIISEYQSVLNEGATFGFPSVGFKKAMASAGYRAKVTKDKVSVFGAFFIEGELVHIEGFPEIREDMVTVMSGGADLRYRPEFKDWKAELNITYNADVITPTQIINLLNLAGFSVGVGEWRPEKSGQFGMFHVE